MLIHAERPSGPSAEPSAASFGIPAGFGCARYVSSGGAFIILVGRALWHSDVHLLSAVRAVRFRVSGNGRVDELVPG